MKFFCRWTCLLLALTLCVGNLAGLAEEADAIEIIEMIEAVEVGGDWRTWRAYSQAYEIGDGLSVMFSPLDERSGYAIYEAVTGTRIGSLIFPDNTIDEVSRESFYVEDRDGDGRSDIGVPFEHGEVMWFVYGEGIWPDEPNGCFRYFCTDGVDALSIINGTLYGVMAPGDIRMADFGYEEGRLTPEQVADALTDWTGLDFSIVARQDAALGGYVIDWQPESSLFVGPPEPQREAFHFFDVESLSWFMLNSFCRTLMANMDEAVDVYYTMGGEPLDLPEVGYVLSPAIAFNRSEDVRVDVG